jgi:release factor glutamine methyltransferase
LGSATDFHVPKFHKMPANLTAMTIGAALADGEHRLAAAGFVLKPRRHAELLLESAMNLDRTELYLRAMDPIPPASRQRLDELLTRREAGEPVQYIVGWTPFYGHRFLVGPGVFIPRFDSEILIERALEILSPTIPTHSLIHSFTHSLIDSFTHSLIHSSTHPLIHSFTHSHIDSFTHSLLDICCGCGAFGLSIAAELANSRVVLSDISETALEYTARNALKMLLNNRIETVNWDALGDPPAEWIGRFDLIVANPPYIPAADLAGLHPDVRDHEPREALTDGGDGLSFYRRWAQTLPPLLNPGGRLLIEIGDTAARDVIKILSSSFARLTTHRDLNGVERVVESGFIY